MDDQSPGIFKSQVEQDGKQQLAERMESDADVKCERRSSKVDMICGELAKSHEAHGTALYEQVLWSNPWQLELSDDFKIISAFTRPLSPTRLPVQTCQINYEGE